MTDKLLSQRLKDLEADGLVERRVHAGPPVRIQYRLTEKGDALSTILLDLNPVGAEMDRPTRRSLMRAQRPHRIFEPVDTRAAHRRPDDHSS
jgi:DNA-binding HxlR family transcriptional regulator